MKKQYKYLVLQPNKKFLGEFETYDDALRFQRSMIMVGAADAKIYDLDRREVTERPENEG